MDRSGERAGAIEQRRKWDDAFARNAAPGWFQPDDAAECGGDANGASRVRSDAAEAEAGSDGRGGPAARAAGNTREVPGIADRAVVRVVGCDAVGEFVHVGLAEENGASVFELCDDCGVFFWNEFAQDFRTCRRPNACRIDIVLQRNRNAVERAAVATAFAAAWGEEFGFCFLGLGEGKLGRDSDVGVELEMEVLDTGEHEPAQLDGRELALAEEFSDLFDGSEGQLSVANAQKIFSLCRRFPKVPMLAIMNAMRN